MRARPCGVSLSRRPTGGRLMPLSEADTLPLHFPLLPRRPRSLSLSLSLVHSLSPLLSFSLSFFFLFFLLSPSSPFLTDKHTCRRQTVGMEIAAMGRGLENPSWLLACREAEPPSSSSSSPHHNNAAQPGVNASYGTVLLGRKLAIYFFLPFAPVLLDPVGAVGYGDFDI